MKKKVNPLRILLADDHPVVREGLVSVINHQPDMTVVAEAANGREAVEQFLKHSPDVALIDLRMSEVDGVEATTEIRRQAPSARVIILTRFEDEEQIHRGLRAGAKGYLLKETPREELAAGIRAVHEGKKCVPPSITDKVVERLSRPELTPRELEVLRLIARGLENCQIADQLFIAESTVKGYVQIILEKLEATNRTHAVAIAFQRGLVQSD